MNISFAEIAGTWLWHPALYKSFKGVYIFDIFDVTWN